MGTEGRTVEVRGVPAARMREIARFYWVERIAPAAGGGDAVKGTRPVYVPEARDYVDATVYARARLAPGAVIAGPAVVEEEGSTLVVGPDGTGRVADSGNLIVSLA